MVIYSFFLTHSQMPFIYDIRVSFYNVSQMPLFSMAYKINPYTQYLG